MANKHEKMNNITTKQQNTNYSSEISFFYSSGKDAEKQEYELLQPFGEVTW